MLSTTQMLAQKKCTIDDYDDDDDDEYDELRGRIQRRRINHEKIKRSRYDSWRTKRSDRRSDRRKYRSNKK